MKYPHTPYFRFSPSVDKEDVRETGYFDLRNFLNKDILFTTKMDGSNCVMTNEKIAARNGVHATRKSFDYAKGLHAQIANRIPENYYVFGEWLYATHSIYYDNLSGFIQLFAIFDADEERWLSWDDVVVMSSLLGFVTVEYSKIYNFNNTKELEAAICEYADKQIVAGNEGIVVRNVGSFTDFKTNVAKYVRKDHVQTDQHWSQQKVKRNIIIK